MVCRRVREASASAYKDALADFASGFRAFPGEKEISVTGR